MFLSKRPNGIYYIFYHDQEGLRKAVSTKSKKKTEALTFLSNFSKELDLRRKHEVIPITLKSFRFQFLKHSEFVHTEKTTKTFKTTFKYFQNYIGDTQLESINEKMILNYIDWRLNNSSIYQARKDIINLSSCFNWGIEQGYLLFNPCKNVKRP